MSDPTGGPPVDRTVAALRDRLRPHRLAGRTIGLVPTMGALHRGHRSLVRAAAADCDVVVVSIFVNPLQFGAGEDLAAYPRTLQADLDLLAPEGVTAVLHPDPADFTPPGRLTTVHVADLTARWEGASRPTHFDGVTTIVAKLLHAVGPDRAYFGEKDFQQQAVIRRMVADLDLPVDVVTCPVVREADGLALSSRNAYLSAAQRTDALALSRALQRARRGWTGDADAATAGLVADLRAAEGVELDYAAVIDPDDLRALVGAGHDRAQGVVAARVGSTRLIDTAALGAGPTAARDAGGEQPGGAGR